MKKAFDQTFRDIKRGVNKKVLKVPSIEQKVLDATSNEPWGPHGTHLADIAQASRNYHEYQMIMSVVWKRINDTGKNWRHVYKGLTVLEYLVANGSERVIDDIREHAYQITALSGFQYIDSTGRDQGSNVRKKSQMLVALVNDKEMIQEVREKAAASREKFRTSGGGMNRPYDDDRYEGRYGGRDEDRNGYGREKEWGDERYGRDGGRYGEDGYKDDEYRGRSRSVDGDYGPRSRSSDRERGFEDDGRHSSRESNVRAEDEPKLPAQNLGAPPTYEDAVGEGPSPVDSKRDGETATAFVSKPSSPPQETVVSIAAAAPTPPPPAAAAPPPATATPPPAAVNFNKEQDDGGFDLFDPRGAFPAAPPAAAPAPAPAPGGVEIDLFGSLSDSFSSDALALVPSTSATSEPHAPPSSNPGQTFMAASTVSSQPFDDPFGDGPFRAVPSTDGYPAQPSSSPFGEPPSSVVPISANNSGFGDTYDPSIDILADILPPTGPPPQTAFQAQPDPLSTQTIFSSQTVQPSLQTGYAPQASQPSSQTAFPSQPNQTTFPSSFPGQFGQPSFPSQGGGPPMPHHGFQPAFSPQGGNQPMPQPAFPAQGGNQPSFPAQGGNQSVLQPGFPAQGGNQSMPQPSFPAQGGQSVLQSGFLAQGGQPMPQPAFPPQGGNRPMPQPAFPPQGVNQPMPQPSFGQSVLQPGFPAQGGNQPMPHSAQGGQSMPQPGYTAQGGQSASMISGFSQAGFPSSNGHSVQPNNFHGGFQPQGSSASNFYQQPQPQPQPQPALTGSTGALAIVPQQAAKEKFETKSTVWADTLNRGLVNLNISGSKTNPLSDIGIDFEAINRKEKRLEKPSKTPVTSNVTMGKAMGSGSGIGRAGAGILRPAPNPMMGPGMGATMGAPGARPGFGAGYGQPMGMNMQQNVGIGMNMGQGFQMQGFPPGSAMPANYNPMMGRGAGYGQQPYGGYR